MKNTNESVLVSVIIPAYNAEKYITHTIESVLAQTHQALEVIVVDDCSTDRTVEVLTQYSVNSRIRVICLEQNSGGPAHPRNIGVKAASGEYVAFLDADDLWESTKIEKQVHACKMLGYNFVSCASVSIDANGNAINESMVDTVLNRLVARERFGCLLLKNFIVNSSVLISKELLSAYQFDDDPLIVAIEDWYLWLGLFLDKKTKYTYMNRKMVQYRIRSNSIVQRDQRQLNFLRRSYCLGKLQRTYPAVNGRLAMKAVLLLRAAKMCLMKWQALDG